MSQIYFLTTTKNLGALEKVKKQSKTGVSCNEAVQIQSISQSFPCKSLH